MQETMDYAVLLQTIERLKRELNVLQQEIIKLQVQAVQNSRNGQKSKKTKPQSLYGILPPLNLTMEDYRAVRRSGTPRSLRDK